MSTSFHELDTVVLLRDVPDADLCAGDLGAVVHVYAADVVEVEFVTASGQTRATVTLAASDVRVARDDDLPAVRPFRPSKGAA